MICKYPEPCWFALNAQQVYATAPIRWNAVEVQESDIFGVNAFADDKYEIGFGAAGAVAGAALYSLTYPIVWIDGPLPLVDAAWVAGLFRFTKGGYEIGSFVGEIFDTLL